MTSATDSQAKDALADENPVPAGNIGAGATAEDARAVAEAARESGWERPSFAKGLYLGSFDLGLVHPWAAADPSSVEKGEEFMARLTAFAKTMSGRVIERDAKIPDEYINDLAALGVFG